MCFVILRFYFLRLSTLLIYLVNHIFSFNSLSSFLIPQTDLFFDFYVLVTILLFIYFYFADLSIASVICSYMYFFPVSSSCSFQGLISIYLRIFRFPLKTGNITFGMYQLFIWQMLTIFCSFRYGIYSFALSEKWSYPHSGSLYTLASFIKICDF